MVGEGVEAVHVERPQPLVDPDGQGLVVQALGSLGVVRGGEDGGLVECLGQRVGSVQFPAEDDGPFDVLEGGVEFAEAAVHGREAARPGSARATNQLSTNGSPYRAARSNQRRAASRSPPQRRSLPSVTAIDGASTAWSASCAERTTGCMRFSPVSMSPPRPTTHARLLVLTLK
jgi:hypothetical protein